MKKSIMRGTLPFPSPNNPSLVKMLDPIKKAGFEGIQLGVTDLVGELSPRTSDADVAKLAKNCRDAGIEPHSIYGGITFFREDETERKKGLDQAKRVLDLAAGLGAKTILIHPGQLSPSIPYDDCWKFAVEGLNALKRQAESTHIRLGLENVWNRFLMSPLEFQRILALPRQRELAGRHARTGESEDRRLPGHRSQPGPSAFGKRAEGDLQPP